MATNISASTALAITTAPYAINLDARTTAQPLHQVWWALRASSCISQINILAAAVSGTTYLPTVAVFTGTPSALTPYPVAGEQNARVNPFVVSATLGVIYYIRVSSAPQNNDLDSNLAFAVTLTSNTTVAAAGSLANTYDIGHGLELRSSVTGAVLQSIGGLPHALSAAALDDGTTLLSGTDNADVQVFTSAYQPVATVGGYNPHRQITSNSHRFYVANFAGILIEPPVVRAISATGTVLNSWSLPDYSYDTGPVPFYGLGVSPDDAILYIGFPPIGYGGGDASGVVRRFDLGSSTYLSNLSEPTSSPHTYNITAIAVLSNGDVVASYTRLESGIDRSTLFYYNAGGSLLHTYSLGEYIVLHLARIPGDNSAFWAEVASTHIPLDFANDHLLKIQVSDGAVLADFTKPKSTVPSPSQGGAFWVTATSRGACLPLPLTPLPLPVPTPPVCCHVAGTGGGNSGAGSGVHLGEVPIPFYDPTLPLPPQSGTCAGNAPYLSAADLTLSEDWAL